MLNSEVPDHDHDDMITASQRGEAEVLEDVYPDTHTIPELPMALNQETPSLLTTCSNLVIARRSNPRPDAIKVIKKCSVKQIRPLYIHRRQCIYISLKIPHHLSSARCVPPLRMSEIMPKRVHDMRRAETDSPGVPFSQGWFWDGDVG